jgi:antitoxin component of MazEF toxin-antitoxin module
VQTVKARRQGNATVVTIPSAIKVPVDTEYYVILNDDQSITLIPKIANFYEAASQADAVLWQQEEFSEVEESGRECI